MGIYYLVYKSNMFRDLYNYCRGVKPTAEDAAADDQAVHDDAVPQYSAVSPTAPYAKPLGATAVGAAQCFLLPVLP